MDWLLAEWAFWWALGGSPAPWGWSHAEAVPASRTLFGPDPARTAVDLWLIDVTYGVLAAESHCARCGAPLSRALRVVPSAAESSAWTISIVTRCGGWRRHRCIATVSDVSNDLVLGHFRAG